MTVLRDATALIGIGSLLTGLWWAWPPLALIVGGLIVTLVALGTAMAQQRRETAKREQREE